MTTKPGGSEPLSSSSVPTKRFERPARAACRVAQRLDADAGEGRGDPRTGGPAQRAAGGDRRRVLLGVGTHPEAVLEVDAKVLDGLALQLRAHARIDGRGVAAHADAARELVGVGRVPGQRPERRLPEPLHGVCLEPVRAAVEGVHRLPAPWFARVVRREGVARPAERRELGRGVVDEAHVSFRDRSNSRRG